MIYLDHQASTPIHPLALEAMRSATVDLYANPHSADHAAGWAATDAIDAGRANVAAAIHADADEIVFTSGATEADNLALLGLDRPDGLRNKIVVSAIEHKAVLGPARELARRGFDLAIAPVGANGVVDLDAMSALIDGRTALVSCMLVNNELGTVQPVPEVAALCAASGSWLHVDAAQALGWMPIDVDALGAHMVSLSSHKMGGPKGVGALFVRHEIRDQLRPILFGGEQESGLRPGTLPTPLCVGFGAACRELPSTSEVTDWRNRTARLEAQLREAIPDFTVNGGNAERHPGALNITFFDIDAEELVLRVQPALAVSRSSACTSGIAEPSHVLRAIGLHNADCERTIRIGVGRFSTINEVDRAGRLLIEAYTELRQSS